MSAFAVNPNSREWSLAASAGIRSGLLLGWRRQGREVTGFEVRQRRVMREFRQLCRELPAELRQMLGQVMRSALQSTLAFCEARSPAC